MLDHGQRKFPRAALAASSTGRGWQGISAELRSHPAGELPPIMPAQMEVTLTLSGDGTGVVRRNGNGSRQETAVAPGTLWLCPIGVYEDAISMSKPIAEVAHVYIPASRFTDLSAESAGAHIGPESIGYLAGIKDVLVEQMIRAIVREMRTETAGGRLLVETLALSLVATLAHSYSEGTSVALPERNRAVIDGPRLRRVLDFIADEIESDLSVKRLADVACLSRFHFARAFKGAMGVSPSFYVSHRRLRHAKALLLDSKRPLSDIAEACGFSSQGNFTRAFKRSVGVSPSHYRHAGGASDAGPDPAEPWFMRDQASG